MVLDRSGGSILRTTGSVSISHTTSARGAGSSTVNSGSNGLEDVPIGIDDNQGFEQMAKMVWDFMNAAGGLVHGLDDEA
jgi:hypothetical protein